MELLETVLHSFVNLAMLLFEYIGVLIITFAGIQGFVNYLRREGCPERIDFEFLQWVWNSSSEVRFSVQLLSAT